MANNFGRVNVSITASTGGLTRGLASATKSLSGFASRVASGVNPLRALSSVAQSTFGQLALFSAARSAVNTLVSLASAAAESVDQLSKLSRRLGTTYGELAGLKLAGDLAGVGIDSIAMAMTKADVAMVKAINGSDQAAKAFAMLGLNAEQLAGMSSADRFEAIAAAISRIPDAAQRSAAAVALFGRSGAALLPMFEGGADAIRQAREEAERFGLTLTNAQGRNVGKMNDSFTRVHAAIQGIVQQVVAYLAPAISGIAKQFTDFVGSVGGANIGQAIGEALLDGAEYLAGVADWLIANFGKSISAAFEYASKVGQQWGSVVEFLDRTAGFLQGVFYAAQAGMSMIVLAFSHIINKMVEAARGLAKLVRMDTTLLDGMIEFGQAFEQNLTDSIDTSLTNSAAGFDRAFGERAQSIGEEIGTPLTDAVRGFRQAARDAAAAVDEPTVPTVKKEVAPVVRISSQDLKAIVSGTVEGESFRNSLRRGADPRLEGKDEAKATADNTERAADGIDELVAMQRDGGMGLASISV